MKKIAPFPKKYANSRLFIIYEALDNLGGVASLATLHKESLSIWKQYSTERKPIERTVFKKMVLNSCVSPGHFYSNGSRSKPIYRFSTYEEYQKKASTTALARSMYTLGRIENGLLKASEETIEKLGRIIDDPTSELPPARIIKDAVQKTESPKPKDNTKKVLEKAAATMERIEKPDPENATNMEELQQNLEKLLERQGATNPLPIPKVEIGVWHAITGTVIITGLLVAAFTAMAFSAT